MAHLAAPRADGDKRVLERQAFCRHERAVFAEAVAHDHVRPDAVRLEELREGFVDGEDGRLRDRGLAELFLGGGHCDRVAGVGEEELRERLAEQRRRHAIRLGEDVGDDRLDVTQLVEHVHVLRALAGVEECDLWSGTAASEDALRTQRLPHPGVVGGDRLESPLDLAGEILRVGVVDRDALGSA